MMMNVDNSPKSDTDIKTIPFKRFGMEFKISR